MNYLTDTFISVACWNDNISDIVNWIKYIIKMIRTNFFELKKKRGTWKNELHVGLGLVAPVMFCLNNADPGWERERV